MNSTVNRATGTIPSFSLAWFIKCGKWGVGGGLVYRELRKVVAVM